MLEEKAELEAESARRKAELEAYLDVLQKQTAAVAALAEAAVYDAAVESEEPLKDFSELAIQYVEQKNQ